MKDRDNVSVPRRRLDRILITSVHLEVTEEMVWKSLNKLVNEASSCELGDSDRDMDIIRRITTRSEKTNWLIEFSKEVSRFVIIDLERYHVVGFVLMIRCYNCQAFGDVASKCESTAKCVKCAGELTIKN